jgi:hypothetical protein
MPGISDLSSSATKAAGNSLPWAAIAQGAVGLGQTVAGMIQRAKGLKEAKKAIAGLGPNQGILDYYNQALNRYNVSPTESALYKRQQQTIGRNVATGIGALQREGNVLGGVSSLVRGASDAALNAEVAAEQQRAQRFGQLASATQAKAAEELRPKQLEFQLAAQRAAGGSQLANTGMSNIFGAAQGYGTQQLYKDIYGTPKEYGSSTPINWRVTDYPVQGMGTNAIRGLSPRISSVPTGIRRG